MVAPYYYSKVNLEEKICVLIDEGAFSYKLGSNNTNPIAQTCKVTNNLKKRKYIGIFLVIISFIIVYRAFALCIGHGRCLINIC